MRRLLDLLLYFLSGFIPRNRRKVVFGAWLGKKCSDNPKFLLLYLARARPDLDLVWIGDENVSPTIPTGLRARFVRRGSLAACRERLTAGACFVTHAFFDVGDFNLMRGARRMYLGHGLAIKHMGTRDKGEHGWFFTATRRLLRQTYVFDHYAACSPAHREKLLVENAAWNIVASQIFECGQPRCDFLLENSDPASITSLRGRIFSDHGIRAARRVITYLPTFRDKGTAAFSFALLDPAQRARLDGVLDALDAVLVEKSHFQDSMRSGRAGEPAGPNRVFPLSGAVGIDTQELLLITDLLITDYSGCYVDFLALDRPILHFAYDRKHYENADRGLYFSLDEVAGGPIVERFEDLCTQIETGLRDPSGQQNVRERVRDKLIEFERGTACQQITKLVLPPESPPSP